MSHSGVLLIISFILCLISVLIFIAMIIRINRVVKPKIIGELIVCKTEKGDPYYYMQIEKKDHEIIPKLKEVTLRVVEHGKLVV